MADPFVGAVAVADLAGRGGQGVEGAEEVLLAGEVGQRVLLPAQGRVRRQVEAVVEQG